MLNESSTRVFLSYIDFPFLFFPNGDIYVRDNNMLGNNLRAYFNVNSNSSMRFLSRSAHSITGSIKIASLSLISASKYVYVLDIGSKSWKFKKIIYYC